MRAYLVIPLIFFVVYSCSNAQVKNENSLFSPIEFSKKIKETKSAIIVDVRTPEEYSQGHLQDAKNIDWNGNDFEKQISALDKAQPIFVYCLSGGRSSSAANKMRSIGFVKVYELDGGILKWRNAGLPETTDLTKKPIGMSKQQFDSLLISDQLVLVDFYAPWCAPCKKMKPELDELGEELKGRIIIFRIDADENQSLFKELRLETLPTLLFYKNGSLVWSRTGYVSKEGICNQLKQY